MPAILAVESQYAPHYYAQGELTERFQSIWKEAFFNQERLARFQQSVEVAGRYLALPAEAYEQLSGLAARNQAWTTSALVLSRTLLPRLFETADLAPSDIDYFVSSTVTGLSVPSLEARLMNDFSFRTDVKRLPLFGLGCLAGCAGVNRIADYLVGHPREAALFLTVELCSLTWHRQDTSIANLISSSLFGDGAAAVLMVGDEHPLASRAPVRCEAWRSDFFPGTEDVMGFAVDDEGFRVILSHEVPTMVDRHFTTCVEGLLSPHLLTLSDLSFFVCHPGGPKVLKSLAHALGRDDEALALSWEHLRAGGNMSSASVLFILKKTLEKLAAAPVKGRLGLMTAMGPAFCAETTLLKT